MDALKTLRAYHQATKHRIGRYAPGPGYLDWDSQPDPFRRYGGAPLLPLPLVEGTGRCPYDALYGAGPGTASPWSKDGLGLFLELALGLSAWKSTGVDRWALRNNPSSGNLHPTEGYLLLWRAAAPDLGPGLYHYAPLEHALEQRAVLPGPVAAEVAGCLPGTFGALGLASVIWREEWKYGARAFRYCQHDVGHALGAARLAAALLGWRLRADAGVGDAAVAACLGLDRPGDLGDGEPEHPDLLAVLGERGLGQVRPPWAALAGALTDWSGRANRLSAESLRWPQIEQVLPAVVKTEAPPPDPGSDSGIACLGPPGPTSVQISIQGLGEPPADACTLIRRRRSAQRMDGHTGMGRAQFERALSRTLPAPGGAPFDALPYPPAIHLVLFVHAVEGLEPGLYALIRSPERRDAFRDACASPLDWTPAGTDGLPLERLRAPLDLRRTAARVSCGQGIAGQGAFSLGMVADLGRVLEQEGAWAYRRLHWEAGLIGQVLYLEAEAAGLRGTGIGCFFDDEVHRLLGLDTGAAAPWQTLYHFTVGAPLEDWRLTTEPPYAHLT